MASPEKSHGYELFYEMNLIFACYWLDRFYGLVVTNFILWSPIIQLYNLCDTQCPRLVTKILR